MKTTSREVSQVSDRTVVNNLATKVFSGQRRRLPFIIGFFYHILKYLLSIGAYFSRCFLRYRLGERTFGIITVLSVYIFIASVYLGSNLYQEFQSFITREGIKSEFGKISKEEKYTLLVIFFGLAGDERTTQDVMPVVSLGLGYTLKEALIDFTGLPINLKVCWWLILILSGFHFIEVFFRRRRNEIIHSFHRGKSIFFEALVGKKIMGMKIENIHVWMFFEPILIYFLAVLFDSFSDYYALSLMLKISAICLFFEEYRVFLENRSLVLDIVDSQIDAEKLASIQTDSISKITGEGSTDKEDVSTVIPN